MTATSFVTEQSAILTRLADNWTEDVLIMWPNDATDPPDTAAYVEPVINRQEAFNADLSPSPTKTVRHPGLLTLNVSVPLHRGDEEALRLADVLAGIFRNVTFEGITFRAPTMRNAEREGARYRVQVDCPFYRDSLH